EEEQLVFYYAATQGAAELVLVSGRSECASMTTDGRVLLERVPAEILESGRVQVQVLKHIPMERVRTRFRGVRQQAGAEGIEFCVVILVRLLDLIYGIKCGINNN